MRAYLCIADYVVTQFIVLCIIAGRHAYLRIAHCVVIHFTVLGIIVAMRTLRTADCVVTQFIVLCKVVGMHWLPLDTAEVDVLNFASIRVIIPCDPRLRSCVKVEVAVLRSPSLISPGFCGCKATLNSAFPSLQSKRRALTGWRKEFIRLCYSTLYLY